MTDTDSTEDYIWGALSAEALAAEKCEPVLQGLMHNNILRQSGLRQALAQLLAEKLVAGGIGVEALRDVCAAALAADPWIMAAFLRDLQACHERDPACRSWLQPLLFYKGVAALQAHRVAHWLWSEGRQVLAMHLQSQSSQIFQVDIHPAAQLGAGLFLDHATGLVIGETSVVGDDVTILQSVTLGGNGKERGDRHPKVGRGVLISVGAKLLGNIHIGDGARIAASAVVLHDVPARTTVAGAPAKPVRGTGVSSHPAADLDHVFAE